MDFIHKNIRLAQYDNGEAIQGAFCPAPPSVVYSTGSVSASTDPFASKTNKYSEAKLILVYAAAAFHIKFGASAPTATTADQPIPAATLVPLVVPKDYPYVAVIPATGSATIYVTEIY